MTKSTFKKFAIGAATVGVCALPMIASAAGVDLGLNQVGADIGLSSEDVRTTISRIIRAFMGLLGLVAVIIILLGGFKWMTAAGNEEQVQEAKKLMISGVIGLVIIMSAFAIAQFVVGAVVNNG